MDMSGDNVILGWSEGNKFYTSVSPEGGSSFSMPAVINIPTADINGLDVEAFDDAGAAAWYVYEDGYYHSYCSILDSGSGWSTPLLLNYGGPTTNTAYPRVGISGDNIAAIWEQDTETGSGWATEIYGKNSNDGGDYWETEEYIDYSNSGIYDPVLKVSGATGRAVWCKSVAGYSIISNQFSLASGLEVSTEAVTEIGATTATGNGNIVSLGTSNTSQHGMVWSTTSGPTLSDQYSEEGPASIAGDFSSELSGLAPGTLYYVRAYATDNSGTVYGDDVTFTTATAIEETQNVGGEVSGINKMGILAPWLMLAAFVLMAGGVMLFLRRRRVNREDRPNIKFSPGNDQYQGCFILTKWKFQK
jgi:hypothetical protein